MKNAEALTFFYNMSHSKDCNPQSVKLAHNTDYTDIDAEFVLQYADKNTSILDIGSGTGLIINKIYDKVKSIECVEPYAEFTKFIAKSDNITIINEDAFKYNTTKNFDLVSLFGFIQYMSEEEALFIYIKCYKWLKQNGKIIVKNQFAVAEDVNVSGYSEEQKTEYYAQYRNIDKEVNMLKQTGFKNPKVTDIYPPKANRWNNTHFYAIVAEKE
jgi:16S rRNA A1518/A1519 N6-dimethyltransferase RsmA/KsgA/DIM1 with predicted DNA glycosylase/AP lyase activity